jgi:ceramide glucosyltransferase
MDIVLLIALTLTLASIGYLILSIRCVVVFRRRRSEPTGEQRPVSILKPICGLDAGLYENLLSFCDQEYPVYQVLFGVRDGDDPAVEVIERLIRELPERDLSLVVDEQIIGPNRKVSNLANMYGTVKYDLIAIADSDMRVDRNYIREVVAPFRDPEVGAVTCLYIGSAAGGIPSILGTMFINEWFLPSVLVALAFQQLRFCLGATMAVRRDALEAIGGFQVLAFQLADDYRLGELVVRHGFRVHLSAYVVENIVLEPSFTSLFLHELRWARTIRSVRPLGYAFSFITYAVPLSILYLIISGWSVEGITLVAVSTILRVVLHWVVRTSFPVRGSAAPWLVPIRDVLSALIWAASFFGRRVRWREEHYAVRSGGRVSAKESRGL